MYIFSIATISGCVLYYIGRVICTLYISFFALDEEKLKSSFFFNLAAVCTLIGYATMVVSVTMLAAILIKPFLF